MCTFISTSVTFLGNTIDQDTMSPHAERVRVIMDYKQPEARAELRSYLRVLNFYRKFIPNPEKLLKPLVTKLRGAKKNDKPPIHWIEESIEAFKN